VNESSQAVRQQRLTTGESRRASAQRLLADDRAVLGVLAALVVLGIALSIASPSFMTMGNILNVVRQSVWVGVMAIGMVYVLGTGGIDLSVGAVLSFSGVLVAALIQGGMNIYLALVATLLAGIVVGALNGGLITRLHLPPFIATLGMMSVLQGLALVYTQGIPIYGLRYREFQVLAQGFVGFLPAPVIMLVVIAVIGYFVLNKTPYGRYVLGVGSNETAARLAGIPVDRIKVSVYAIAGLLSAVAGILLTSRGEAAVPNAGEGYELDVIAAAVIGGTAMNGGRGSISGAVVGAVFMTMIRNGLNLLGVSTLWHQVVIGVFIVGAVALGSRSLSGKRARRTSRA